MKRFLYSNEGATIGAMLFVAVYAVIVVIVFEVGAGLFQKSREDVPNEEV